MLLGHWSVWRLVSERGEERAFLTLNLLLSLQLYWKCPHYHLPHWNQSSFECQVQLQVKWSLFAVPVVFLSERLGLMIYGVEDSPCVRLYSVMFASSMVEFKHHS